MRFSIYFNRKLCFKIKKISIFYIGHLLKISRDFFRPPQKKIFLEKKWTIISVTFLCKFSIVVLLTKI